MAIGSIPF